MSNCCYQQFGGQFEIARSNFINCIYPLEMLIYLKYILYILVNWIQRIHFSITYFQCTKQLESIVEENLYQNNSLSASHFFRSSEKTERRPDGKSRDFQPNSRCTESHAGLFPPSKSTGDLETRRFGRRKTEKHGVENMMITAIKR